MRWIIRLEKNGLSATICILFELKNGDKVIGTCQLRMDNILLQVEIIDGCGNFTFKPNKEIGTESNAS